MLAVKHFVDSIKTALQKTFGLRLDIRHNQLQRLKSRNSDDYPDHFRYVFSRPLAKGWYMLHVNGVKETLGHDFQFQSEGDNVVHMQIGAKVTTKRIIHLSVKTTAVELAISPGPANEKQFNVSLVRISERFAISRMFRKLASSNGVVGRRYAELRPAHCRHMADRLYKDYSGLMQRHVNRVDYQEWLQVMSPALAGRSASTDAAQTEVVSSDKPVTSVKQGSVKAKVTNIPQRALQPRMTFVLIGTSEAELSAVQNMLSGQHRSQFRIEVMPYSEFVEKRSNYRVDGADYIIAVGAGVILNSVLIPELNRVLAKLPDTRLFYSDHDVLSTDGQRSSPAFKPGWNKELLMAGNYIGNFLVMKQELYRTVGGFDLEMESSVFYDFLLRASTHLKRGDVERIPRMLFSRSNQEQQGRTGMTWGSKDKQVLEKHLHRNALPGQIKPGLLDRVMRVDWQVPTTEPMVDIIIPTRDRVDLLRCCVDSIFKETAYQNYRITVVDNGSSDPATHAYYETLRDNRRFNVEEYPGEFNYSAINNYAVAQTSGDIVVLLNNDTEICKSDWLTNMVAQAVRPEVGCVGAKLYYSSGLIQHAGVIVGIRGVAGHAHRFYPRDADGHCGRLKIAQNVSAVTAACLAVRREIFEEVGGLDEVNLKVAYNDVDFCLRVLEAGYDNIWTPHVELYHHESVSRGSDDTLKKARRFQQEYDYMISRWHTDTMKDPSYNPNLALDQEDFWLAA